MSKAVKKLMLDEVKSDFAGVDAAVVVGMKSVDVHEATALRKALREKKVKIRLVKNSLARIAFREMGVGDLGDLVGGQTAILFSRGDALAPSKAIEEWLKKSKKFEIRGGLVEGRIVTGEEVRRLATLPGRPEQLARFCGLIVSPLHGLMGRLSSPITQFARLLASLRESKAKAETPA